MEIELILGSDSVGRIYQKLGAIHRPIATISFEEIPEEIPVEAENPEVIENKEEINIEDYF